MNSSRPRLSSKPHGSAALPYPPPVYRQEEDLYIIGEKIEAPPVESPGEVPVPKETRGRRPSATHLDSNGSRTLAGTDDTGTHASSFEELSHPTPYPTP